MKWYNRFALQFLIDWRVFPGQLGIKGWLFSSFFRLVFPGQEIRSLAYVPQDYASKGLEEGPDALYSRYFWLSGSIRVFGLDLGVGVFYLANPKE